MIERVRQAVSDLRAIAGGDRISAAEEVIDTLLDAIGSSRAPVANDQSRRDKPFWT